MILLTIPVLFPAIMALDFYGLAPTEKAIWFGILVLMVVEIGLIAPPVGLNVYVIHSLAKDVPMAETYRGVVPFLMTDAIRVTLLVFFPMLSLWLVRRADLTPDRDRARSAQHDGRDHEADRHEGEQDRDTRGPAPSRGRRCRATARRTPRASTTRDRRASRAPGRR